MDSWKDKNHIQAFLQTSFRLYKNVWPKLQSGEFDRFAMFTGPINDNQGNEVIPAGVSLTQSDLEGLSEGYMGAFGIEGREPCTICMDYLVEGFVTTAEIPPLD